MNFHLHYYLVLYVNIHYAHFSEKKKSKERLVGFKE